MVKPVKILGAVLAMSAGAVVSAFTPCNHYHQHQHQSVLLRPTAITPLHATATPSSAVDYGVLSMSDTSPSSSSAPAILDRPLTTLPSTESDSSTRQESSELAPNSDWILRIYNDNINTREYVAVCLVQIVGLCETRAYYTMQDAHDNGIAKVGEYNQEVAECYEEQLQERGVMCDVVASE